MAQLPKVMYAITGHAAPDSLRGFVFGIGLAMQGSRLGRVPYAHYFYQQGRWSDQQVGQLLQTLSASFGYGFGKRWHVTASLETGLRTGPRPFSLQQAYVNLRWGKLQLMGGRRSEQGRFQPQPYADVGDMGYSANHAPFERIGFELTDYMFVPWLRGWLSFHGAFFHGWLDKARHISRPWWHQKQLHIRIGSEKKPVEAVLGLRHYVIWGGRRADGTRLYSFSLKKLWDIARARPLPEEDGENAGGSHVGVVDYALAVHVNWGSFRLYRQNLFEDDRRILTLRYHTSPRKFNGLWGLAFESKNPKSWFRRMHFERVNTSRQGGPGLADRSDRYPDEESNFGYSFYGRDDIYNNYFYLSGYTYGGFVLGQALALTRARTQSLGLPLRDIYSEMIWNNRIRAYHLMTLFRPLPNWHLLLRYSYVQNEGTYFGLYGGRTEWEGKQADPNYFYFFAPPRVQHHMQLAVGLRYRSNWHMYGSMAVDTGQMYHSWGLQIGVRYVFSP